MKKMKQKKMKQKRMRKIGIASALGLVVMAYRDHHEEYTRIVRDFVSKEE